MCRITSLWIALTAINAAFGQGGWVRQFPLVSPAGRSGHTMVFDGNRQSVILFGGMNQIAYPVETWRWTGTNWVQIASNGPSGREKHTLVYDSNRQRCVLFGGMDWASSLGDTWEWDGNVWAQVATSGPLPRNNHAMCFDSWRNRVVLFGGTTGSGTLGDTWEWDGTAWTQRVVAGPSARQGSAMTFDSRRGRTVLYGAMNSGDTWEWDGSQWFARVFAAGPPTTTGLRMEFDELRRVCVLLAYRGLSNPVPETWHWDGTAWSLQANSGPSARTLFAMAFDHVRQSTLLFGGLQGGGLSDTWEWRKPGTATSYGSGCGSPPLEIRPVPSARPAIGGSAEVTMHNIPSSLAFMALGWSNGYFGAFLLPVDLGNFGMPGCMLLQSSESPTLPVQPTSLSEGSFSLSIPNLASLVGIRLYLQGWAVAPGLNLGEKVTSNALEWLVGY